MPRLRCRVPRGDAVALTSTPRQERAVQLLSKHVDVLSRQHYSLEDNDLQALQYIRSSEVSLSTRRSVQSVERGRLGEEAGLGLPVLIGRSHFRQLLLVFLSPYHSRHDGDSIQVFFVVQACLLFIRGMLKRPLPSRALPRRGASFYWVSHTGSASRKERSCNQAHTTR